MFGRHGTVWQVLLAITGLLIVTVVLVVPHGRGTTLESNPAAVVGSNAEQNAQSSQPVVQQAPGQDTATPAPAPSSDPAASAGASGDASGSANAGTGMGSGSGSGSVRLPAAPAPAVSGIGRTLFSDNFMSDPLGLGLPSGWQLGDPLSTGGGLAGLPILGALLGGGQSSSSILPSTVQDGTSHVLTRAAGSWSRLSAGPSAVDYSASADVEMVGSGSGFAGVAGRFVNASNFLACGLGTGGALQLWQVAAGRQQLLASTPAAITSGVFHTVRMNLQGGQASCSVDGGSSVQASGVMTGGGRIGLVALGDMASQFDNVLATALP
jgi:hypothetical protein